MQNSPEEKVCLCALNMVFGAEPRIANALLDHFGSAKAVFGIGRDGLEEILGPYSKYTAAINAGTLEKAAEEIENAARSGIAFAGRGEAGYPALLAECEDSPAGLYIRSAYPQDCFDDRDFIAIVGTRNASDYGRDWCRKIIEALSETGRKPVIVSGLAYGTDITAHLAALDCGLDTVAVMATGADSVYPARHRGYAERIAAKKGSALVSDYPLRTAAMPVNFVRRNRIIAGICRAVILTESRYRGGGMITARQAFSYDRDVYTLPGRAGDPLSEGCNWLIRSGTAAPIISGKDLLESLGYPIRRTQSRPEKNAARHYGNTLDGSEVEKIAAILLAIKRNDRISLTGLAELTGFGYRTVAELTGLLENDGFISVDLLQRCTIRTKSTR